MFPPDDPDAGYVYGVVPARTAANAGVGPGFIWPEAPRDPIVLVGATDIGTGQGETATPVDVACYIGSYPDQLFDGGALLTLVLGYEAPEGGAVQTYVPMPGDQMTAQFALPPPLLLQPDAGGPCLADGGIPGLMCLPMGVVPFSSAAPPSSSQNACDYLSAALAPPSQPVLYAPYGLPVGGLPDGGATVIALVTGHRLAPSGCYALGPWQPWRPIVRIDALGIDGGSIAPQGFLLASGEQLALAADGGSTYATGVLGGLSAVYHADCADTDVDPTGCQFFTGNLESQGFPANVLPTTFGSIEELGVAFVGKSVVQGPLCCVQSGGTAPASACCSGSTNNWGSCN